MIGQIQFFLGSPQAEIIDKQEQADISRLPTEIHEAIAADEYPAIAPLVQSCKKFYAWGACRSLLKNPKNSSKYVRHLLESFNVKYIERSLSRFPRNVVPLELSSDETQPFDIKSLRAVSKVFQNVTQFSYTRGYRDLLQMGTIRLIDMTLFECSWGAYLLLSDDRVLCAFKNSSLPLLSSLAKITMKAKAYLRRDLYLENVASLFPMIQRLSITFDPKMSLPATDFGLLIKPLILPAMPHLKFLNVQAIPHSDDYRLGYRGQDPISIYGEDLSSKTPSLECLELAQLSDDESLKRLIVPTLKEITLKGEISRKVERFIRASCPSLTKLSIKT